MAGVTGPNGAPNLGDAGPRSGQPQSARPSRRAVTPPSWTVELRWRRRSRSSSPPRTGLPPPRATGWTKHVLVDQPQLVEGDGGVGTAEEDDTMLRPCPEVVHRTRQVVTDDGRVPARLGQGAREHHLRHRPPEPGVGGVELVGAGGAVGGRPEARHHLVDAASVEERVLRPQLVDEELLQIPPDHRPVEGAAGSLRVPVHRHLHPERELAHLSSLLDPAARPRPPRRVPAARRPSSGRPASGRRSRGRAPRWRSRGGSNRRPAPWPRRRDRR